MDSARGSLVIGLDYGTDSVRAVIVNAVDGTEISNAVYSYERWGQGRYCDSAIDQFRQHPQDYLDGLKSAVRGALTMAPRGTAAKVRGISIDTTGSTPVAVDRNGVALSLRDDFRDNPNAMFVLWKDHTAIREAVEINQLARSWGGIDYTRFSGGIYSSEWFWAKILHILRTDPAVGQAAWSWVEHCDWMPGVLTGNLHPQSIKRSRCAAGHKAMWHESFGGLPSEQFLNQLDPLLAGLRSRLYRDTVTADRVVGTLAEEWASELGLSMEVVVGSGAFDAHMGAVGGQIKPYVLAKVMGTSTCDMLIAPASEIGDRIIPGICGQVDGSIVPGAIGLEAGQSAFGDVYAWFANLLMWPLDALLDKVENLDYAMIEHIRTKIFELILPELQVQAAELAVGECGITALDWINGRRTPDANQALTGAVAGLKMGTDASRIFRGLAEATAFGARKIIDRFREEKVPIHSVIALGGVARKSPFIMQLVADVLEVEIKVVRSDQACALGAAMFAAVCAGLHPSIEKAQDAMGSGFESVYRPGPSAAAYQKLYEGYTALGSFIEKEFVQA